LIVVFSLICAVCLGPLVVCITGYQTRLEKLVSGRLTEDEKVPSGIAAGRWWAMMMIFVVWSGEHRLHRDPTLTRWAMAARWASLLAGLFFVGSAALIYGLRD
jgi:hypothetical protein